MSLGGPALSSTLPRAVKRLTLFILVIAALHMAWTVKAWIYACNLPALLSQCGYQIRICKDVIMLPHCSNDMLAGSWHCTFGCGMGPGCPYAMRRFSCFHAAHTPCRFITSWTPQTCMGAPDVQEDGFTLECVYALHCICWRVTGGCIHTC